MVLEPNGYAWTNSGQTDFRLSRARVTGAGRGLPVFTLVPRASQSQEGRAHTEGASLKGARSAGEGGNRTRAYGGHDLIVSGSMPGEAMGLPSFSLTPEGKMKEQPKPYSETKRKR